MSSNAFPPNNDEAAAPHKHTPKLTSADEAAPPSQPPADEAPTAPDTDTPPALIPHAEDTSTATTQASITSTSPHAPPTGSPPPPTEPPQKKKNPRLCPFPPCRTKKSQTLGLCPFCDHIYCTQHRLPEDHGCENLRGCRDGARERNQERLLREKCVAAKV